MSKLRLNIAANFGGSSVAALLGFIFIPLYVKFLGIESYGLLGFFVVLQSIFAILELGMGAAATRQIAKYSSQNNYQHEIRSYTKTLEIFYSIFAIFIGLSSIFLAPLISSKWLNYGEITKGEVDYAVELIIYCIALLWTVNFYNGVLIGLQKMVLINAINVSISIFRNVGAVFVLWLISPTIRAYFEWQLIVSIVNLILMNYFVWRSLPKSSYITKFKISYLTQEWRFTAGMSGIMILSTVLTQVDKLILTKLLTLADFGYYMLASTVQAVFLKLINPIFVAANPKFTSLVSNSNTKELISTYHLLSQLVSVLIYPAACVIIFFPYELMFIWTQNIETTKNTYQLVRIFSVSMIISCSLYMPYALQLAYGETRLSLISNFISVIILFPLIIVLSKFYGGIGAAIAFLILNIGYIFIAIPIMYKKIIPTEKWKWYLTDLIKPLFFAIFITGLFKLLFPNNLNQLFTFLYILIAGFISQVVVIFSIEDLRFKIKNLYLTSFLKYFIR